MRLLIVHPSLNRCGGAERVCLATVKALSARGHNVHLATIDRIDCQLLEERFWSVQRPQTEEYMLNSIPFSGSLSQAAYTVAFFLPLLAYQGTAGEFDLMVNTYGDLDESIADVSYINAIQFRLRHLFPNSIFQSSAMRVFTSGFRLFSFPVHKLLTSNVPLTNSTFMRDIIRRHYARDCAVIFPPVNLQRFKHAEKLERRNLVVTVTRLRRGKELEIIPRIARHVRNCRFIIFGLSDAGSEQSLNALNRSA